MSAESPEQLGQVMPTGGTSTRPLDLSLVTIDAGLQMAEMEHVFRPAGNHTLQTQALATLRRWQFDPRLDSGSQERAGALVWKFQPNGWDEV